MQPDEDVSGDQENEGPVITPGGPRQKKNVHRVEPGQTLRRNPDGTYSIVPATPETGHEPKEKEDSNA